MDKEYTNTKLYANFGFYPLGIILITVILWVVSALLWLALLIINFITSIFGFVFVIFDWGWILFDWILGWSGSFIIGYFTMDHWFNWLMNVVLLFGAISLGFIVDIFSKPSLKSKQRDSRYSTNKRATSGSSKNYQRPAMNTGLPKLQAYVDDDIALGIKKVITRYQMLMLRKGPGSQHPTMDQYVNNYQIYYNLFNEEKNKESQQVLMAMINRSKDSKGPISIRTNTDAKIYADLMRKEIDKMNNYMDML